MSAIFPATPAAPRGRRNAAFQLLKKPRMRHAPTEVFSLSGVIEGTSGLSGGYAIAHDADSVILGFRELGFHVVSVSSMADIATAISALEALVSCSPEFPETDYLNLLESSLPRSDATAFTFTGSQDPGDDKVFAGFAVAPDRRRLSDYLGGVGFTTYSIISLADLRAVYADLQRFAAGDEDEGLVSFKP